MNDNSFSHITGEDTKTRLKNFVVIFLPGILVLFALSIIFYQKESTAREELLRNNEMFLLENQIETLRNPLKNVVSDLKVLASQQEMLSFLDQGTKDSFTALAAEFLAFSTHRQIYDRIRFIDRKGMEIIRVNYNYGLPKFVPQEEQQYVGNRDYFENTLKLKAGEFYMSPITLNSDMGKIDNPPTPVITCGIAVFDRAGQNRGVIILTYLADQLLQPLRKLAQEKKRAIYLVNGQGFYLLGPTPQAEWGFLYPDRKDQTFQARFPSAWESISFTEKGHILKGEGLFIYITFYPQLSVLEPRRAYLNPDGPCGCYSGQSEEYYWKLISFVPAMTLHGSPSFPLGKNLVYFDAVLLLLLAVTAWLLADTTAQRNASREKLREKETRLLTLLDNVPEGIISVNEQGIITTFNPAAARIFGYTPEESIGRNISMLIPPPLAAEHDRYIKQFLAGGKSGMIGRQQEVTALHRDGRTIPVQLSVSVVRENKGWTFTAMARDISEQRKMEHQLLRLVTIDALTNIFNRPYFTKKLSEEFDRALRHLRPLSLILIDVDRFKSINDIHGPEAGDAFLQALAALVISLVRNVDTAARYGEEEIAVILPGTTAENAMALAEQIRQKTEKLEIAHAGGVICRTISLGVSSLDFAKEITSEQFVKMADDALTRAKEGGGNKSVLF
ncbi:MAG: diguanylate cyclase [Proteobacteria bacterium]|nr:diguanylate cyclase [Pseudomonadota bacterium]MBU4297014.1 diguanylate cyclase [Pseudomonadota bacterium]MCG2749895.1 diguanylate cyclase [Desulfobulbaceae bacterium]